MVPESGKSYTNWLYVYDVYDIYAYVRNDVPTYLVRISRRSHCISQEIRCHASSTMTLVPAKNNNHTVTVILAGMHNITVRVYYIQCIIYILLYGSYKSWSTINDQYDNIIINIIAIRRRLPSMKTFELKSETDEMQFIFTTEIYLG